MPGQDVPFALTLDDQRLLRALAVLAVIGRVVLDPLVVDDTLGRYQVADRHRAGPRLRRLAARHRIANDLPGNVPNVSFRNVVGQRQLDRPRVLGGNMPPVFAGFANDAADQAPRRRQVYSLSQPSSRISLDNCRATSRARSAKKRSSFVCKRVLVRSSKAMLRRLSRRLAKRVAGDFAYPALARFRLPAGLVYCASLAVAPHTPAAADDGGTAGQIAWDASFFYVCIATNTWVRAALTTW